MTSEKVVSGERVVIGERVVSGERVVKGTNVYARPGCVGLSRSVGDSSGSEVVTHSWSTRWHDTLCGGVRWCQISRHITHL